MEWSIPGIWFYMDHMVHIISGRLKIYVHMSFICSSILEILDIWCLYVLQKRRAPKNNEECPDFRAEISHMRPGQGQKLKLFITPFCGVINLPVEWFTPQKVYHSTLGNSLPGGQIVPTICRSILHPARASQLPYFANIDLFMDFLDFPETKV